MASTTRLAVRRAGLATWGLFAIVCVSACAPNLRRGASCAVASDSDGNPPKSSRYARSYRELAARGDPRLPKRIDCELPPPASFVSLVLGEVISYGPESGPPMQAAEQ